MPKQRKLKAEYLGWIAKLPAEMQETALSTFEADPAYGRLAGLDATQTQASQQAAEYKRQVDAWEQWRDANPAIEHWQHYGPLLNLHTPQEIIRRLQPLEDGNGNGTGNGSIVRTAQQTAQHLRENQTRLAQLERMKESNELTWEEFTQNAKPLVDTIQSQQQQIEEMQPMLSDYSDFRNKTVPNFVAGVESRLKESSRAVASRMVQHEAELMQRMRYAQDHPDRKVDDIARHAAENNLSWMDGARDLYGDDDRAAEQAQFTKPYDDRIKKLEDDLAALRGGRGLGDPGEGPPRAMQVYMRSSRREHNTQQPPRPVAKNDGEVRSGISQVLARFPG